MKAYKDGGSDHRSTKAFLRGQVAAVTGAGRGIGKCIAHALGRAGAFVVLCDIDNRRGKTAAQELRDRGCSAEFMSIDLGRKGAPRAMVRRIVRAHGRLDILVNNARAGARTSLLNEDEKNWELGLSVMLRAAFFAAQEAVRAMSKIKGGCIVNVSSIAATLACPESPSYHVAKAGLLQMTRYLASHAGRYGVRANAVLPGFIVQDEHRERYEQKGNRRYRAMAEFCHPAGQVGRSDDVAQAVLFLCSPEAAFISGEGIVVDGGLTVQEPSGLVQRWDRERHGI